MRPYVESSTIHSPDPHLLQNYYGQGYGVPTLESQRAIQLFAEKTGMVLEGTYTGKAAAAYLDILTENQGPVLFWNTFSSVHGAASSSLN